MRPSRPCSSQQSCTRTTLSTGCGSAINLHQKNARPHYARAHPRDHKTTSAKSTARRRRER
jgi:hypothetical protein